MKKKVKNVHGVGTNDADYFTQKFSKSKDSSGKVVNTLLWACPYYLRWKNMLARCYDQKRLKQFPTYEACSVSESWLLFSNFRDWCILQEETYNITIAGLHLDKDILVEGNKVYCPECCVFVDPKINTFMLDSGSARGSCLIGTNLNKSKKKYEAWCRTPHERKAEYLGVYDSELVAHEVWRARKHEHSCFLATSSYVIDTRVEEILLNKYSKINWYK